MTHLKTAQISASHLLEPNKMDLTPKRRIKTTPIGGYNIESGKEVYEKSKVALRSQVSRIGLATQKHYLV